MVVTRDRRAAALLGWRRRRERARQRYLNAPLVRSYHKAIQVALEQQPNVEWANLLARREYDVGFSARELTKP